MITPDSSQNNKFTGHYPEPWLLPKSCRWLYRALLGRPMDNLVRTDSTFWHRARGGHPSRWLRLAGWERAALRLVGTYVFAWVLLVLAAWVLRVWLGPIGFLRVLDPRTVLEVHAAGSLVVLIPLGTYRRVRDFGVKVPVPVLERAGVRVRLAGWVSWEVHGRKEWDLEKVRPVAAVAAHILALSIRPEKAGTWVTVPRNYRREDGDPVEIMLPSTFSGADEGAKKRLGAAVANRLGLKEPIVEWSLTGSAPRMLVSAPPAPPEKVLFADVAALLGGGEEYRPLMGLVGANGKAAYAEMISDSPHIALSAGPGAGKSTLAKLVAMQALRWGWGVVFLDWKMTEAYEWARGLPGVRIINELEGIHNFGVTIGQEVDERKRKGLTGRVKLLVIRDEWNVTADLLMAYWDDLRATADPEERKTMPRKSPALRGFAALDFGGREFGLHDFVITQRMSARVFNGNADIRECFGIRCLARYSPQTKQMLVGNIKPFPRKSSVPGRWVIVTGDDVVVVQVPLITGEEAREFASGGIPNPSDPLTTSWYPEVEQRGNTASALGDQLPHGAATILATPGHESLPVLEAEAVEVRAVEERKLSEMVNGLSHLGITLKVLQKAAGDLTSGFPMPISGTPNRGYRYDYLAVQEWARRRHAVQRAKRRDEQ